MPSSRTGTLRRRLKGPCRVILLVGTVGIMAIWLLLHYSQLGFPTGRNDAPQMMIPIDRDRPNVVLRQGRVFGVETATGDPQIIETFLGIPYGLSTAGKERFKPPRPVNAALDDLDAGKFGDRCPNPARDRQSEDCLNLNIYRPKGRPRGMRLPVVIHFHGGAFNGGPGNSPSEMLNFVSWSTESIIAVTFNYRVGAFGFLPSRLTAKEGLLNVGLKDQALAMQWVQDNIAQFGGDPDNVTLMGSSAGAHAIGHHLLHNTKQKPPFARVIIESGSPTARNVYTYSNALHETQFKEFIDILGLSSIPESKVIERLRELPFTKVQEASWHMYEKYNPSVRWPWQPVIDGHDGMIPSKPIEALKNGHFHKVPIMTGYNTNEGSQFVPSATATNEQFLNFFRTLLPGLWDSDFELLEITYPDPLVDPDHKYLESRKGVGAQYSRLEQAYGHFAYVAPVRQLVHLTATTNTSDPPVYLYHFAPSSSVKRRADHGTQEAFLMNMARIRQRSKECEKIAGNMHAYWTSFIVSGDPNSVKGRYPDRMKWPRYTPGHDTGRLLVFGEGNDEVAGGSNKGTIVQIKDDGFAREESKFWWARTELFEL